MKDDGKIIITGYNGKERKGILFIPGYVNNQKVHSVKFINNVSVRSFTYILIGDGIAEIGENCFTKCFRLQYVGLPFSLKTIGPHSFSHSSIEAINISRNVKISETAFSETKLHKWVAKIIKTESLAPRKLIDTYPSGSGKQSLANGKTDATGERQDYICPICYKGHLKRNPASKKSNLYICQECGSKFRAEKKKNGTQNMTLPNGMNPISFKLPITESTISQRKIVLSKHYKCFVKGCLGSMCAEQTKDGTILAIFKCNKCGIRAYIDFDAPKPVFRPIQSRRTKSVTMFGKNSHNNVLKSSAPHSTRLRSRSTHIRYSYRKAKLWSG